MSYLVLARKYRPKVFADVVGQDHVIRPLINALKSGRTAHAYLLAGARGVGKTTVARLLAMALNCRAENLQPPCGQCDSCVEIRDGHAVDVFEIDGASNRGINEIRELRETVKYFPGQARFKVYIIDEVHMLTKEAFNALLKTLEEPPAHVVFIFATTEAHKVLPTILSRCQRYDFKRIGLKDIVARLEDIAQREDIRVSPFALRLMARESEGSLRDALSLFDQVIAYTGLEVADEAVAEALGLIDQTLIAQLARAVLARDASQALDLVDRAYNFGYDAKDFALRMLEYFRALVVTKVVSEPEKILDVLDEELAELKKTAAEADLETLHFHFNAWLEVQERLQRTSQPRLVLEAQVIRLAQVEPLVPLAELAARLEILLNSFPPDKTEVLGASRSSSVPTPDRSGRFSSPGSETFHRNARAFSPADSPRRPDESEDGPEVKDLSGFKKLVKVQAPFLFNILEKAEIRRFDPEGVEVVFEQNNLAELMDGGRLLTLLAGFFGQRPRLEVKVLPGGASPETPKAGAETVDHEGKEKIEREILNHPLVQEAKQVLSGEIIEVIPED